MPDAAADSMLHATPSMRCTWPSSHQRLRPRQRQTLGPQDPWEVSKKRSNQQIFVRLRAVAADGSSHANAKVVCVATYHMPCVFWDQRVMTVHCALSARHVQRLARSDPYVFAGDFNIKPLSGPYRMLTQGALDSGDPDLPPSQEHDPWRPQLEEPLESAYCKVQGQEPDFTNYAQIFRDDPFIDCIDYIFCKPGMRAVSCDPLPSRAVAGGPFPIETEPSDHIMLGADFEL